MMKASNAARSAAKIAKYQNRIAVKRKSKTPFEIARYAKQIHGQFSIPIEELGLNSEESGFINPTLPERIAAEKRAKKKAEEDAAAEARRASAPELAPKRKSLSAGLSAKRVCEQLDCSLTELNRWEKDGRLIPDGEKFYCCVGPHGVSCWGRAWLPETVDAAGPFIDSWRVEWSKILSTKRTFSRRGLRPIANA